MRTLPTPLVAHVVAIDLAKASGVLKVVAERGSDGLVAATVSRLAELNGLVLAVNASFFQVPAGKYPAAGERADAVGGLILDGEAVAPKGPGLGLINAGLCIDGRNVRVEKGFECKGARYGLASGPLLLWHGEAVDTEFADKIFKSLRHPRTAVGVDSAKQKVWLLVVDGRQPGVSEGATLDELKQMLKDEGATDALNLDGGGSSVLVARSPDGSLQGAQRPHPRTRPGPRAAGGECGGDGESSLVQHPLLYRYADSSVLTPSLSPTTYLLPLQMAAPAVLALRVDRVEVDVELRAALLVAVAGDLVRLLVDALEREEAGLLHALPLPHELHDRVRAARHEVRLAAPRGPAAADAVLRVDRPRRPPAESPTRPGILKKRPDVVVTPARSPLALRTDMWIVPCGRKNSLPYFRMNSLMSGSSASLPASIQSSRSDRRSFQ